MKALDDVKKIISFVGGQLKSTFQMLSYLKKMKTLKPEQQEPTEDTSPPKGKKGKVTPPKLDIPEKEVVKETSKKKKPPAPPLNILNDEPPQGGTSWWMKAKIGISSLKFPRTKHLSNPYIAGILLFLLLAITILGFWALLDIAFPTPSSRPAPTSLSADQQKDQSIDPKEKSSLKTEKETPKTKETPSESSVEQSAEEASPKEKPEEAAPEKAHEEAHESSLEKSPPPTDMAKGETPSDEDIPYQPPLDLEKTKGFLRTVNPHFFAQSPPLNAKGVSHNIPPRVVIVVYNVGINEMETDLLLSDLPNIVTLSLSPYASQIDTLIEDARFLGHSTLIQMPWEDELDYTDQGFLTVCTGLSQERMMDILNKYKILTTTADGFFAQGGGKLMLHPNELSIALKFIATTKNCLVAPPDVLMTALHESAVKEHLNYVSTSILSPNFKDIPAIESLAKRTGFAVIAFPISKNITNVIEEWIDKLEALNIDVVPLSKIIKEKK